MTWVASKLQEVRVWQERKIRSLRRVVRIRISRSTPNVTMITGKKKLPWYPHGDFLFESWLRRAALNLRRLSSMATAWRIWSAVPSTSDKYLGLLKERRSFQQSWPYQIDRENLPWHVPNRKFSWSYPCTFGAHFSSWVPGPSRNLGLVCKGNHLLISRWKHANSCDLECEKWTGKWATRESEDPNPVGFVVEPHKR